MLLHQFWFVPLMQNFNPSQGLQMPNQQSMDMKNNLAKPPYYCNATYNEINRELDALQVQTTKGTELHRQLETEQEQLSIKYHEYQKICCKLWFWIFHFFSTYTADNCFVLNNFLFAQLISKMHSDKRVLTIKMLPSFWTNWINKRTFSNKIWTKGWVLKISINNWVTKFELKQHNK